MLWNRGIARKALMGYEPTMNPTPAAYHMLGKKKVSRALKVLKKKGIKRRHKGNPLPAVVGLLGGAGGLLGKLGGRFRQPSEVRAAKVAPSVVQAANGGNLTAAAGLIERAARPMLVKESLVWKAAAAQLSPAIVAAVKTHMKNIPAADQSDPEKFAASVLASPVQLPGVAPTGIQTALGVLQTPGLVQTIGRVAGGRRSRRSRYPTYTDRYGRQRYSSRPPGSQMRLPAGASIAEGTPYSFFSGAVGKGGGGTTAAQLGVAAAAGTAAYFGTQAILKHFGSRALNAEEGGVAAALAAREARYQYAVAHNLRGAPPSYGVPPAVIKEIGAGMKAKLAELGYNAQGVRTRSAAENFLSDYNPED